MIDHARTPVTRRELRLAERAARRAPWDPVLSLLAPARGRHSHPRPGGTIMLSVARVTVCALLLAGGAGHAQVLRHEHAVQVQEVAAAADAEAAAQYELVRQERVSRAASTRLTIQAAAYAAHELDRALAVAQAAVQDAGAVVATAAPVVSAEQLSSLDAALVELTAMIESSPRPAEVAAPPSARPADPAPAAEPAPTSTPTEPAGPAPSGASAVTELSAPAAPSPTPTSTPAATSTPTPPLPTAPASAPPAPTNGPVDVGPLETAADLSTLGLEVSARLIAAAQMVTALTSEVRAAADAGIAAAQAEADAAAAAEAARAELAAKVAAVDRAANGAVPLDSLCGVGFTSAVLLRCDAAVALEQLNTTYRARFGMNLEVQSTYRDLAGQTSARELRGTLAAVPGTSNHGRGVAVDLGRTGTVGQFDAPTYLWLKAHAEEYGWHHPVYMEPGGSGPFEPWHWEFGTTSDR